ncbi:MAG TPA: hypothetical protein VF753_19270 [Terriglobales bacterium]
MARTSVALGFLGLALALLFPLTATARSQSSDRVQIARDIYLESGDQSGDLVCVACSIHVRGGQASGDAVSILGSITVENGQIAGDAVAIAGRLRLVGSSHIGGDATSIIGGLQRDSDSTIGGDQVSLGGPIWFLLIIVLPFAIFAAFVTLVIWLVQRLRTPPPPYPGAMPTPPRM